MKFGRRAWVRVLRRGLTAGVREHGSPSFRDFVLEAAQRRRMEQARLSPAASRLMEEGGLGDAGTLTSVPRERWGKGIRVSMATFGCQMNVSDSEVIEGLLRQAGFIVERYEPDREGMADAVLFNTCAIRDGAEKRVLNKLREIRAVASKKRKPRLTVGVLGCMAERMKTTLLQGAKPVADVVVGPDGYRELPLILATVTRGRLESSSTTEAEAFWGFNLQLSLEETYSDVAPVRSDNQRVSAFVSIMRGCDNLCSYCIVPFTRGRERSRPMLSILDEVRRLADEGYREVCLLGQNVNSYNDLSTCTGSSTVDHVVETVDGFKTLYRPKRRGVSFAELLDKVSTIDSNMRIRFTSPHPKDFPMDLVDLIAERPNICNQLHVPLQSGSSKVLQAMRRGYDQHAYLSLVSEIRGRIPDVSLSTDIIAGFCGEDERDHTDTLNVMRTVGFDKAFMFAYSQRDKTHAARNLDDDVPQATKQRRLKEINELFYSEAKRRSSKDIGSSQVVLVDGVNEDSSTATGKNEKNQRVKFEAKSQKCAMGDYVTVYLDSSNGITHHGFMTNRVDAPRMTNKHLF